MIRLEVPARDCLAILSRRSDEGEWVLSSIEEVGYEGSPELDEDALVEDEELV